MAVPWGSENNWTMALMNMFVPNHQLLEHPNTLSPVYQNQSVAAFRVVTIVEPAHIRLGLEARLTRPTVL